MTHPVPPSATAIPARAGTWRAVQPWVSLAARLGVAAVALWAAIPKLADIQQSIVAVGAYDILPPLLTKVVGIGLPIVELAIGLLLLAGLLTRPAAIAFALLMGVFIVGIAQAWARGINIDCGCFGGGGALPEGQKAPYAWEIARDVGLAALAAICIIWPRSRFSLDAAVGLTAPERT